MAQPSLRFVTTADGVELASWVLGPEDGPPVLFLAGAGADHRGWRRLVPELCFGEEEQAVLGCSGRSLTEIARVAVFDQRGSGRTDSPPASTAELLSEDALAVGRALLGDRFAVAGYSVGGMAALHATLNWSGTVTALALISSTAGGKGLTWPSPDVMESAAGLMAECDEEQTRRSVAIGFSPGFTAGHPGLIDFLVAEELADPHTQEDWAAHANIFTTHDVSERLEEIDVPTVVICGEDDDVIPVENSRFLAEGIENARLVIIPEARHAVHIECPDRLKAEILALVRG
jgi:pimeloyl-ACP methyl ester carboxylesterase